MQHQTHVTIVHADGIKTPVVDENARRTKERLVAPVEDRVAESIGAKPATLKTGRNSHCYCGSGKNNNR